MKVLLLNPEFPEAFWSYSGVCKLMGYKALFPPMGLLTVAAMLPEEWELRLFDLNVKKIKEKDWEWAEMVMISGMIAQRGKVLSLIKEAKNRGKIVVTGGPYGTSMPNEVLDAGCDFLFIGEVEQTISSFITCLKKKETKGVFTADQKPDLSKSPIPRYDLIKLYDYGTLAIQISRGCPYNCEFCDIINLFGRKPRHKTNAQVIEELEALYSQGWRGPILICDDNFIGNREKTISFLHELIPWMENHGKPFDFITQTSIDLGQDLALIDLMTEANFAAVFVGIESPDEDVLVLTQKKQNIRNPLVESVNNINKNGLSIIGSFILGFDGETKGADDGITAFVDETNIPTMMVNLLQAPPGTQLWNRLLKEDRLKPDLTRVEESVLAQNFITMRPEKEIKEEFVQAIDYLYEPSRFLARSYEYILTMRPTRATLAKQRNEPIKALPVPRSKPPLKRQFKEIMGFMIILWRQGILARYRWQFWKQLIGVKIKNPSRMIKYISFCIEGENLFQFRKALLNKANKRGINQLNCTSQIKMNCKIK
jgi:radical SAM superfamily enzyme YgiQ (UPF0313 family)